MLAGPIPALVDHRQLANQQGRLSGDMPVSHFARFAALLAEDGGDVHLDLAFDLDSDGQTEVRGSVSVAAALVCQSCLTTFTMQLETALDYVILPAEAERQSPEEQEEDKDSIIHPDQKISIRELVEDDLILAVPMIPRHPDECPASEYSVPERIEGPAEEEKTTHRPFAGLAEAMKKQNEPEN